MQVQSQQFYKWVTGVSVGGVGNGGGGGDDDNNNNDLTENAGTVLAVLQPAGNWCFVGGVDGGVGDAGTDDWDDTTTQNYRWRRLGLPLTNSITTSG